MQAQMLTLHRHTPTLTVADPRGLAVRSVGYCRSAIAGPLEGRVNRTAYDGAGRAVAQWDPRLLAGVSVPANLATVYSLSGKALSTTSVDAGWRASLLGEADQPVQGWDGRGSQRRSEYDDQLRPLAVFEQALGDRPLCTERLGYGGSDPACAERNQCGQLIRHDDSAGTQWFAAFGLMGGLLEQMRQFLSELDAPDWPELVADRGKLLEPGVGATTRSRFNPVGEVIEQIDAKTNRQFFSQTVGGQLREVRLQLPTDPAPKTLVSAIRYNAHGQIERETAGNGVLTMLEYTAEDGRLSRLQAKRGNDDLQNLHYEYDPVGNVLSIEDAALPIRYFANQRIEPINRYRYDSLYQLIEATGWEAGAAHQGPSSSTSADPAAVGNYRQTYRYDAGNNLLELTHVGPQNPGHRLAAAAHSNRCLPVRNGVEPGEEDFRNGFDANGNLLNLQPGQALSWDLRNQLCEVRPVERDSGPDDRERYLYGADGMRVRKVRSTHTKAQTVIAEVRYLPGLELRTHSGTGEVLQVISVQAGRGSVRVLHWEAQRPAQIANDQQRYSLSDHLGSSTLELDHDAKIISQERYYPFGGTAWADGEAVQVSYKVVRYSGKERDATGLYYYGFRYYASSLQRWLNPDPAGQVDGLNIYRMVRNNPVSLKDSDGRQSDFKNLFKPEQGDLIFGMYKIVERRYLSSYARFIRRGDVLGMYFTRKDTEGLVGDLAKMRSGYVSFEYLAHLATEEGSGDLDELAHSLDDEGWGNIVSKVEKGHEYWSIKHDQIKRQISNVGESYYETIRSSQDSLMSSKVHRQFSQAFAAELSGGKYSVSETFKKYHEGDDKVFLFKFVSRASKAGLSTILNSEGTAVVHFMLDGLDMGQVVNKTTPSLTSSELRYLYRNRGKLADKVLFYQNGKLVDAPWRADRSVWDRYKPKSESSSGV
ncbi:RHS repeat-associated core domain-containing protein [Pseudomonas purpurea]|uniref:RHS repeat-associated core domain-containing protein n=1 Tax=Pseudomonas purpurea TaxID=3136737 RepID=UPI0032672658